MLVALTLYVIRSKGHSHARAMAHIGIGTAVAAMIALGFWGLGSWLGGENGGHDHGSSECHHGKLQDDPDAHHARDGHSEEVHQNLDLLSRLSAVDLTQRDDILALEKDRDTLAGSFDATDDEELKVALARRLTDLDPGTGCPRLVGLLKNGEIPIFRSETLDALTKLSKDAFGYQPLDEPDSPENREAIKRWDLWLKNADL